MANHHDDSTRRPHESETESETAVVDADPVDTDVPRYAVILHNDDYTSMEFVVEVLQKHFRKSKEEAYRIMLRVHREGRGVAGVYSFEIAETKAKQVMDEAQAKGFPLRCTVEHDG